MVDFGSGKHYLTFALHHYLSEKIAALEVTGVEQRPELVLAGKAVASKLNLCNIEFIQDTISESKFTDVDVVVALHACDTATDDALIKAIKANAHYICVAPCCHKYLRQRFIPSDDLSAMLRHGILEERFVEGLTDSLRVLILEALGYQTKLFEFISLEHTAKNIMITAVKTGRANTTSLKTLRELKSKFGVRDLYLDRALGPLLEP